MIKKITVVTLTLLISSYARAANADTWTTSDLKEQTKDLTAQVNSLHKDATSPEELQQAIGVIKNHVINNLQNLAQKAKQTVTPAVKKAAAQAEDAIQDAKVKIDGLVGKVKHMATIEPAMNLKPQTTNAIPESKVAWMKKKLQAAEKKVNNKLIALEKQIASAVKTGNKKAAQEAAHAKQWITTHVVKPLDKLAHHASQATHKELQNLGHKTKQVLKEAKTRLHKAGQDLIGASQQPATSRPLIGGKGGLPPKHLQRRTMPGANGGGVPPKWLPGQSGEMHTLPAPNPVPSTR